MAYSKFKNKKVKINDKVFDSMAEGDRYVELNLMQRAGEISGLKLQPEFVIIDEFKIRKRSVAKTIYRADFMYIKSDDCIVEDVKGKKTMDYMLKRKLFLQRYGEQCIFIESKRKGRSFELKEF